MYDVVNDRPPIPSLDFNRLKIVTALGRGAKGVVFLVRDVKSSESFALKVIWRDLIEKKSKELDEKKNSDNDDKYRRISFEQQVLRNVEHPLLPRLRGVLSTDKFVGYGIDYCPGRDLNSLRKKQTEQMFSDDTIRFYAAELVLALEYLHNMGIVYRDLKPENIMIQENGHIMLVDFDLSTKLSPKTPQSSPKMTNPGSGLKKRRSFLLKFCNAGFSPEDPVCSPKVRPDSVSIADSDSSEKSNSFVGTEEYVAPEMIEGKGHDFAVDWWSLGIVLHEMLYGTTPFKGSNRKETFYRILCRPADLVGEPTPLRNLIGRLLEKDPTKRIGVEKIKGHEFFKGVNWELLLKISRPPNIPSRFEHENETEGSRGREGTKEIDVEKFVQGIFSSRDDEENNKVNVVEKNKNNEEKASHLRACCEADNFLVF